MERLRISAPTSVSEMTKINFTCDKIFKRVNQMKKVLVFISIFSFVGCTAPEAEENIFGAWDGGYVVAGSESSTETAIAFERLWKGYTMDPDSSFSKKEGLEIDLEAMRLLLTDSANFLMSDGTRAHGAQDVIDMINEEAKNDTIYEWEYQSAFAVNYGDDKGLPYNTGEFAHILWYVEGTYQGEVVEQAYCNQWYNIIDGKIDRFESYKMVIPKSAWK